MHRIHQLGPLRGGGTVVPFNKICEMHLKNKKLLNKNHLSNACWSDSILSLKILFKEVFNKIFGMFFFFRNSASILFIFRFSQFWEMENIQFFHIFIENNHKNGIYSMVSNLNHGNEPNSSQDFDIDYHTCNKKD